MLIAEMDEIGQTTWNHSYQELVVDSLRLIANYLEVKRQIGEPVEIDDLTVTVAAEPQ